VGRYQKGKSNLDFTEARDSEWQWHQLDHMQVCTSLQTDIHTSTQPLSFLQAGCPSCHPTNSVKALKANHHLLTVGKYQSTLQKTGSSKSCVIHCRNLVQVMRQKQSSYLVSAPVPDRGRGLAQQERRPRHIGADGIAEHDPRVVARMSAGVVGVERGGVWDGSHVAMVQLFIAADVIEAYSVQWSMYVVQARECHLCRVAGNTV